MCDIVKTLKSNKSTGPNSILTKILQIIKISILIPLSTPTNKSSANETFLKVCKPILNNAFRLLCNQ